MLTSRRLSRNNRNLISEWWWTVDRMMVLSVLALLLFGFMLVAATSSLTAARIGVMDGQFFSKEWLFFGKHLIFVSCGLAIMFGISLMSIKNMRRLGLILFVVFYMLLAATLFAGTQIKGSVRWLNIGFISIQPSEFIKPGLIIFCAWMFSQSMKPDQAIPGKLVSLLALLMVAGVLVCQPDLGQTILMLTVWSIMFFMTGANILWFVGIGGLAVVGGLTAYFTFHHVQERINGFLFSDEKDIYGSDYQREIANKAFKSGEFWGKGPGEGTWAAKLPDAHTDYIFSVTGEEYGLIVCLFIIFLFGFLVVRTLKSLSHEQDYFKLIAGAGLVCQFGLQAFINMAVNLNLFPPKGMTLPFISYGGSSSIALAIGMGFLLCLTRRRAGGGD